MRAIARLDVRERDQRRRRARGLREAQDHVRRLDHLGDRLEPGQRLEPALGLTRLARLVAEAVDERLHVAPLGLLLGAFLDLQQAALARAPLEGVVAAGVGGELAQLIEMHDLSRHPVQQIPVMADQEQGARIAREVVLEPEARLEVEVVGRLVEQEQIGLGEQHRGQRHPHPPAAGEARERPRLGFLLEAQPGQDRARPRRGGVGADVGEPGLDRRDLGRIVGALSGPQQPRALEVGIEHRLARRPLAARRLLRDRADARAAPQPHLTRIRAQLAPDQSQQRGLAAAVAADQADPVARRQADARALEQEPAADPQADVVEMQHGGRDIARPLARPNPLVGLDEALGLAVGTRRVRPGAQVAQGELAAGVRASGGCGTPSRCRS